MVEQARSHPKDIFISVRLYRESNTVKLIGWYTYADMLAKGKIENQGYLDNYVIYLLREGEILPVIMTIPTGSLSEFTKYITRLVAKGNRANSVVTKFTLKKAQNSTGIAYSQVVCSVDRALTPDEKKNIAVMSDQVKAIAGTVSIETDAE